MGYIASLERGTEKDNARYGEAQIVEFLLIDRNHKRLHLLVSIYTWQEHTC
jgi:hypothetical protein